MTKIIKKPLNIFFKEGTFELPKRLVEKNYAVSFYVLKNLDLVRNFAVNRYELTSDYIHFLKNEQIDEN